MNIFLKSFAKMNCEAVTIVLRYAYVHWKSFVIVFAPVLLLPLALIEGKEAKCGFVICVMAVYWMTEVLPLPVTSLIPIVLFPLFGILSTDEVCMAYFKQTNVIFLGGVIIAIGVEYCNLHKRIALKVMLMVGTSPQRLMLGFMATTMFLSMWISNSAATALMAPIVVAVLDELKHNDATSESQDNPKAANGGPADALPQEEGEVDGEVRRERPTRDQICYFLGIAYAANIGGTGTITGTATNLVFKGIFESNFADAEGLNFATWMQFNVPLMLFNTFLAWLWLQILYMGLFRKKKNRITKEQQNQIRDLITRSYEKLGPLSYHECSILVLFVVVVSLWFFRKPEFIPGWSMFFPDKPVKDATPAIAIVILLFVLPANLDYLKCGKKNQRESPPLLTWKVLEDKVPFGIILLLGGGFAVSRGCTVSGLSDYLGCQLQAFKGLPLMLTLSITAFATTFATEVSSNTAIANILLPVLAKMCRVLRIHPLYLMMPTTICCSYAFMLPVATPPNAIVMAVSNMKTSEMMKAGVGMNIICVTFLLFAFVYIGVPIYGLDTFPSWAEANSTVAF